mgnify:CR=1 FL=1
MILDLWSCGQVSRGVSRFEWNISITIGIKFNNLDSPLPVQIDII